MDYSPKKKKKREREREDILLLKYENYKEKP